MPHMSISRFGRGNFGGMLCRASSLLLLGNDGVAFGCACTSTGHGMSHGVDEGDGGDVDALDAERQAGGPAGGATEIWPGSRDAVPPSHAPDRRAAAPAAP